MIYLDNNATTAIDPAVVAAMLPHFGPPANPSSTHQAGRQARRAIDHARRQIASALHADPDEITFTSGATEANNLAIHSALRSKAAKLLVLSTEHPSVLEPLRAVAAADPNRILIELPVNCDGVLSPDVLAAALDGPPPALVAVQLANSETGVVQDIAPLAAIVRERAPECWFHCDAVQAVGKVAVDFHEMGVTSLAVSAHKIHGPTGVGALLVRRGWRLRAMLSGGLQQQGHRPGTEPVAGIVGLGAALQVAEDHRAQQPQELQTLRDLLEARLAERVPDIVFNGSRDQRLPQTSNISFLGCSAEALVVALDLRGVCCSAGTACASGSIEPSPVLQAMNITGDRLTSAVRFAVSRFTIPPEINAAVEHIAAAVAQVRSQMAY